MSNMSKKVTAREFLHNFATVEKKLRPGESVTVTRRGTALGTFTKNPPPAKIELPNFEQDASRPGFDAKVGDRVLARLLNDEGLS